MLGRAGPRQPHFPPNTQNFIVQCGVSIQRQYPAMFVECARILIWLSVSREKAPKPNFKVHFVIRPLGAVSQEPLPKIKF